MKNQNNLSVLIKLLLLVLVNFVLVASRPETPTITSVKQINEKSISIKWTDKKKGNMKFTRFKLSLSTDNFYDNSQDWPVQFEKLDYDYKKYGLSFQTFFQTNVNSTFECYIRCNMDPGCDYALFKQTDTYNCFLKTSDVSTERAPYPDSWYDGGELIKITEYQNEVIINDLPVNQKYSFCIAVFDYENYIWSEWSMPSKPIPVSLDLSIAYKKENDKSIIVSWKQKGDFKNYEISRYTIKAWSDSTDLKKEYVVTDLNNFDLDHDYYDLKISSRIDNIPDDSACYDECVKNSNCVRYAYFRNTLECYSMPKVNLAHSVYRTQDSDVYSLINLAKEYHIKDLVDHTEDIYLQVEYKTLYGVTGLSNVLVITNNSDGSDNNEEEGDSEEKNDQQNNQNSKKKEDDEGEENKKDESQSSSEILDQDSLTIDSEIEFKVIGQSASIGCHTAGKSPKDVKWTKENSDEELKNTNSSASSDSITNILIFDILTRKDEGKYICSLRDDSSVFKTLKLVVKASPTQPEILNATVSQSETFIKWNIKDKGGVNLSSLFIEWSDDFNDNSKPISKKIVYWENKADEIFEDKIQIDFAIPEKSQVRITATNEFGDSETSKPLTVKCITPECIETAKKLNLEEVKNNEDNKKIGLTTILLLSLIGIILLLIIIYIIFDCTRKKQKKKAEANDVEKSANYKKIPQGE